MPNKITVLIIDDSALMRRELSKIIDAAPGLKVIGTAADGLVGLQKAKTLDPDVVTIDINLPGMDGITCLQHIMLETPRPCVIISAHAGKDAVETFEALELGAVDFVQKPSGEISRDIAAVSKEIIRAVTECVSVNLAVMQRQTAGQAVERSRKKPPDPKTRPDRVIVIGVSTGGPRTLMQIISALPPDLGAPVLIVQHMPQNFTANFAARLDKYSFLNVREAAQGEPLLNNMVYVAPGGYHLRLVGNPNGGFINLSRADAAETLVPSVDQAMDSAIEVFGKQTVGVILTGMGNDGAFAMQRLHRLGGETIAESQETAVIYGMPKEVIEKGAAKHVVPAYEVAQKIVEVVQRLKLDA